MTVKSTTLKNPLSASLTAEWHPTKNGDIDVNTISSGSNRKVWWLGKECGHEWEAIVANRGYGRGCSYCSGKYILPGFNDLLTLKPLVASQFHPTKNAPLTVDQVGIGSNKKVWWVNADCGHEWLMKVATRNDHIPCSVCDGFIVIPGYNDIMTTRPDVVAEWHPTKNNNIDITMLGAGSGRKVWWLGKECGHEWQANIANRTGRNDSCIYCVGSAVLIGFNDLQFRNPLLAKEWHPTKNLPLLPIDVSLGSSRKVWWQCGKGHEWQTTIGSRSKGGHACPYCTGRNTIIGTNDIVTTNPSLALEWDYTKNFPLKPNEVKGQSNKKVWWKCKRNHSWDATVNDRSRGQGCPQCAAKRFISKAEQEIADFLMDHDVKIDQTNQTILNGKHLDIFIPDSMIAIEYNGLYWHGDLKISDNKYHYTKWLAARNAGIQLIQIWEDEWNRNPEQIKSMLLHKLGISKQERIFARKTKVNVLKKSEMETFLNAHHIQGFASASYYFGLKDINGDIVSVIGLKKEAGNKLNIIRYATSKNVVGGFTKLLKYAEDNLDFEAFVTFSDNCVSDGGLYENNGFIVDKELPPDYRYVVRLERKHKFGYRLKKFRDDPNLEWQEGLTERELALLNKIPRIWDAGKTKWIKQVA